MARDYEQPNVKLTTLLNTNPGAYNAAGNLVTSLWKRARGLSFIQQGVDRMWNEVQFRVVQVGRVAVKDGESARAEQYRVLLETIALFEDLLSLGLGYMHPLMDAAAGPTITGQIADTPEARAMLKSRPMLAKWLAARDAAREAAEAAQEAANEQARRDGPPNLLKALRARGIDLQAAGHELVAPPGTDMTRILPSELAAIKDWKPELTAILKVEAATRTAEKVDEPVVLA